MEEVICDLCGANAPDFLLRSNDRFSDRDYILVTCSQCGLVYLPSRPTQDEIEQYYPDDYEAYYLIENDRMGSAQWHLQRALKIQLDYVEQHSKQKGNMLDVGSATGNFMKVAQDNGWQVLGIEPIGKAAQIAREHYQLEVITGTLDTAELSPASYDVITMWDVLEHLPSPKQALQRSRELLKPGGILVFSIPNIVSFDRYLFGQNWIGWDPPRHFNLFSEQTLSQMIETTGLELTGKECILGGKGTFLLSLDLILDQKRFASVVKRTYPLISALLWPYRQISYLLKRGPIITYAVRKPGS